MSNIIFGANVVLDQEESQKTFITGQLTEKILDVQTELEQRFASLLGLEALVGINHSIEFLEENFDLYAAALYNTTTGIRAYVLAPDGINTFVYPFEGNEAAVGYNILNDSRETVQADLARMFETNSTTISGPYELRQGGWGIVLRHPLYFSNEFWGLASMVVDLGPIIDHARIVEADEKLKYAIRNNYNVTFFGDPEYFNQTLLTLKLDLIDGFWEFVGIPTSEFEKEVNLNIFWFRFAGVLASVLIFTIFSMTLKLSSEIEKKRQLKKTEQLHMEFNTQLEEQVALKTRELTGTYEQQKLFQDQLLKSSQFKSDFMARMSHELRTPLNSILGFTDVILERISGEINADQEQFLTNVKTASMHLLDLINDILDIAKIESGKMELKIVDVPLAQILDEINTMIKPLYEKKNLMFERPEIANETVIQVDRLRFKEILFNLLSNAVKYTQEGGVKLEYSEDELLWKFSIKDTGIGIKDEDFPLVFQDFKRIPSADVTSIEGTGLGLPLTKKLIEYHGGNISFTSEFRKGSTFTFTIPKKAPKFLDGEI